MRTKEEIKQTGATFTPLPLANYLASLIVDELEQDHVSILDPACGDGALLAAIDHCLTTNQKTSTIMGYDSDLEYLDRARNRLMKQNKQSELVHKDFIEHISTMSNDLFSKNDRHFKYDAIIANPPYVRTQVLGAEIAQKLAFNFNLKGRVDLYYPFLIGMTQALKDGGILGVITSNRYLSTRSGESIRKYLTENFQILKVIDLGDTKIFDAAVLPAIFLGKKKCKNLPSQDFTPEYIKIYEELNGKPAKHKAKNLYQVLNSSAIGCYSIGEKKFNFSKGVLTYDEGSKELWEMLSPDEVRWVKQIEFNAEGKIKDWFKVRVGVKTTADSIFIRNDWATFGKNAPENELIHTLISGENIDRWSLNKDQPLELLYTHYDDNGKKKVIDLTDYPKAAKYLETYRSKLEGRKYVKKAKRNWFEIWVPQNPGLWKYPKLVFPDISVEPRFYFDFSGSIVNGNCYWISATDERFVDRLKLIQGVSNSKMMSTYHDLKFNNKLYSGRRRYFSQFVENYPIPNIDHPASKKIINLVDSLNSGSSDFHSATILLNDLVQKAFNLK